MIDAECFIFVNLTIAAAAAAVLVLVLVMKKVDPFVCRSSVSSSISRGNFMAVMSESDHF